MRNPMSARAKRLIMLLLFVLLIAGISFAVYTLQNRSLDDRSSANVPDSSLKASFTFGANQSAGASLTSTKNIQGVTASTVYPSLTFDITVGNALNLTSKSKIRIAYPVTAGMHPQYGWTMSKPAVADITIKTVDLASNKETANATSQFDVKVGDLNEGRVTTIPFIQFSPKTNISNYKISVTIKNVKIQDLTVDNNVFQVSLDKEGNNDFRKYADLAFNVFSKSATSTKVFMDASFTPGQQVKVNVTPIYTGNVTSYRYPNNDENYEGNMVLKLGSGSTTTVTWPDGTSSASKLEYTFKTTKLAECARNCTTTIVNIKPNGEGTFYLEGKIAGKNYDRTFGISNPSSSNFLKGTSFANKKIYFGDWHSHYTDNKSNLEANVNYGRLGFRTDFVGGTNKTGYDYYPQNEQITEKKFQDYLTENDALAKKYTDTLIVPNEEWPKNITNYNPYRGTIWSEPFSTNTSTGQMTNQKSTYPNAQYLDATVRTGSQPQANYNWIHQMILFRNKEKSKFFSLEEPEYSNFFSLVKEVRSLGAVMIAHHAFGYDWHYYDSNIQSAMRVIGFNLNEFSSNGNFDRLLLSGAKIGFVGESDSHQGTAGEGGISGVYMNNFNHDTLLNSIQNRETYASSSFGKPLVYFNISSPIATEIGKETIFLKGEKPTLRFKVALSAGINHVNIQRGIFNGSNIESINLIRKDTTGRVVVQNGTKCTVLTNVLLDCTWTDTSAGYNFYFIKTGSSNNCNAQFTFEHCAITSPIWITRSAVNYVYGDSFNQVSDQGQTVELKTKFTVDSNQKISDAKNLAVYMANSYPGTGLTKTNYKNMFKIQTALPDSSIDKTSGKWYDQKTEYATPIIDFKVRNLAAAGVAPDFQFVGINYNTIFGGTCPFNEDRCIEVKAKPGQPGQNRAIYINSNATYSLQKTACKADRTNITNCSYAWLDLDNSKIETSGNNVNVTWKIGFDPILGERIYDLYDTAFMRTGTPQAWRRIGSVLANPTVPSGTVNIKTVEANSFVLEANAFSDDLNSIKGAGNIYFRVTDIAKSETCSPTTFVNEDWYSVPYVNGQPKPYTFKLLTKGSAADRKLCYYFKDVYGLQSAIKTSQ